MKKNYIRFFFGKQKIRHRITAILHPVTSSAILQLFLALAKRKSISGSLSIFGTKVSNETSDITKTRV